MLAKTFSVMIVVSLISALLTGNLENVSREFAVSVSDATTLCLSLLGMMCFWSGLMKVLSVSGILNRLSGFMKPILKTIYGRQVLSDDNLENLSASVSANFLGLGNAAIPLGVKTVKNFEKSNKTGVACDATIMFSVLNTVPFQLIPSTLIAMRTKYGSVNAFDVVPYIWLCSVLINVFAVIVCKVLAVVWGRR